MLADGPRLWVDRGTTWGWAIPVAYVCARRGGGDDGVEDRAPLPGEAGDGAPSSTPTSPSAELPERVTTLRPPDAMDAELLRWCYAFADQPDDGLAGLDWGEQFHGGTQLRYQLNSIAWAMSLYAANYLPNAPERMTEALAKVVHKHTDLRVWGYWRTLNLLGNFDPNPDPIRRDNIMFSAFFGDVINSFEAATGDLRFDEPASLTFVWKDGRTFEYDHHSHHRRGAQELRAQPARVLPVRAGLVVHRLQRDGRAGAPRPRHDPRLGRLGRRRRPLGAHARRASTSRPTARTRTSARTTSASRGTRARCPAGTTSPTAPTASPTSCPRTRGGRKALDLRGAAPKMAMLSSMVVDGTLALEMPAEPERHHTASSAVLPWIKVIGGARLVGDERLIDAAIDASARQCATGRAVAASDRWRSADRASVPTCCCVGRPRSTSPRWPSAAGSSRSARWWRPRPEVLITLARSDDGVSHAAGAGTGRTRSAACDATLHFTRLSPGAHRLVGGDVDATFDADADGTATVTISLDGPVSLVLDGAAVILNCDRLWTRMVTFVFRVRRKPRVTQPPTR